MNKQFLLPTTILIFSITAFSIEKEKIELNQNNINSFDTETNLELDKLNVVTPSFQNPIHSSDLSSSANPQYSIKSSGRYYLAESLTKEHNTASGIILLINSNNVTLDMNSKSIEPHISGSLSTGTGIAVAQGASNISIMNGTINGRDHSGTSRLNTGLDLAESSVSGGSGTTYSIKVRNIYITGCKKNASRGDTINDLSIEGFSSNDNTSTSSNVNGISLSTVNNFIIRNSEFNNNSTTTTTTNGIALGACKNGIIENCTASNNSGTTGCNGLYIYNASRNIKCSNVNTSNNTSSSGVVGIQANNSPMVTFENCTANNIYSTSGSSAHAYGFLIQSGSDHNRFINCSANESNSTATTSGAYGFWIASDSNYFENVQANSNNSNSVAKVAGIYLNSSSNNTFINCSTNRNQNTNTSDSDGANAYGVYITSGSNNSFLNCNANGNSTSAASTDSSETNRNYAVGFYSTAGTTNSFKKCTANNNIASNTAQAVRAAGFLFASTEKRSQIDDCKASSNLVGSGSSSASTARAYGIFFDSTSGADQCIVKNSYLAHNSVSSSGLAFGFYDNDTTSTSLLTGNISIGHGKCLGGSLDASNQWNNNSEPSSSQNYFFKHTGTGDDPKTAIQEVSRESFASISSTVQKWQNISVYNS